METVGFIGLGSMGAPMAWNVRDAGFSLRAYNRSPERTEPFREAGVPVADSPRAAAEGADAVVTMVTDGDALFDVLEGDDGVLAGLQPGSVVVNTSTVAHDATTRAAAAVRDRGGRFVDAPVVGTLPAAEDATLTVLVGGEDGVVDDVEAVLEAMGSPLVHAGAVGQGTNLKLTTNLLLGGAMQAFAEALVFGRAHDLALDDVLAVVGSGGLDAPLFQAKGSAIREGDFSPLFPVDLLFKDLNLVLDAAGEAEVPLPVTAATREAASATRALGHGDEDMAALVRHLEATTGVRVRDGTR